MIPNNDALKSSAGKQESLSQKCVWKRQFLDLIVMIIKIHNASGLHNKCFFVANNISYTALVLADDFL
jgi:hypothetical protein